MSARDVFNRGQQSAIAEISSMCNALHCKDCPYCRKHERFDRCLFDGRPSDWDMAAIAKAMDSNQGG